MHAINDTCCISGSREVLCSTSTTCFILTAPTIVCLCLRSGKTSPLRDQCEYRSSACHQRQRNPSIRAAGVVE
ncbi:hypothetical protein BD311DRAFT_760515 [Dichomitus squalens]|uniref:Uncharacterized protein n=1 Tax=Dichomitus squalens TaxID=114155 RepID=A0A4Q9MLX6_9APHY|nr:hypothetical protein BD311DRAFT_760515 [Dichomitus squalens]TBU51980.1 hypothetical protein BD310DRAFT_941216 [Dichomitus squalens]